jgi:hypothetical protein
VPVRKTTAWSNPGAFCGKLQLLLARKSRKARVGNPQGETGVDQRNEVIRAKREDRDLDLRVEMVFANTLLRGSVRRAGVANVNNGRRIPIHAHCPKGRKSQR